MRADAAGSEGIEPALEVLSDRHALGLHEGSLVDSDPKPVEFLLGLPLERLTAIRPSAHTDETLEGVSTAEWVGAVGTSGATLIAAGALAGQQFDRRRGIAASVNGWTKIEEGFVTHIILSNASRVPVYDVIARVIFNSETIAVTSPDTLPPGATDEVLLVEPVGIWACLQDLNLTEQGPKVALVFRDPAGRVWRKRSNGRLRRQRRKYDWAEEYQRATTETPPPFLEGDDGSMANAPYERQAPRE